MLCIHNFYGSEVPSGENAVFESEKGMLIANGHEIEVYTRHNDEIRKEGIWGAVRGAFSTPMNPWAASAVWRKVIDIKPDIVHAHNTFPLISPSIFPVIGENAARVLTLHNYRLFCPNAIPMRNGYVCEECMDRHSSWPSVKHGCYRGSRLATIPLAISVELHRFIGTWRNEVDAFIVLSDFQKQTMVEAGLPEAKVHVKPNFTPDNMSPRPWNEREQYVLFAGRLSEEKGVEALIKSWVNWGKEAPELRMVGDGPLREKVEKMAVGKNVKFTGKLSPDEAKIQMANAKLLIYPSQWYEPMPLALLESLAVGTPAAVSDIGPLPTIVKNGENGVVFKPANPESLLAVVKQAWKAPGLLEKLGAGARKSYEEKYTEEKNYKMLMEIYEKAIAMKNASKGI